MSEDNQKTLESFIKAVWNQGDLDAIDSFVADSYTIHHDPGDPWDHRTLTVEGLKERVRISREPVPDQTFEIQSLLSDENRVFITWLWKGTHLGEVSGFEATGKELLMSGATIYYFEQGKITGHWQIADRLSVYQQLMANSIV